MSSIWTPGGEQPVRRAGDDDAHDVMREPTEEEMAAHLDAVTRELAETPASVIVANHAMGLFELGAVHLSRQPPDFPEAQFAIDAMAALVEGLAGRYGEHEQTLKDALAQIRLAFVQIRAAGVDLSPPPPREQAEG